MDRIHPRIWKELAGEVTKPLSIICHQSWPTGEVPGDCRLTSVTPICKKGWKEHPGKYRPVGLTSVLGKEQITSSVTTQHVQDKGIRPSQQGSGKGRSYLAHFHDWVLHLLDKGKVIYWI